MNPETLLKTLLHELKDGVIACDADAKITLFNPAAANLFGRHKPLRKGGSLYKLCFQPPVEQALRLLHFQHASQKISAPIPYIQFMNASISQERFFRCRVSFLGPPAPEKNAFVIIFEDVSAWYVPDNPLFMKIEEFRAPMTNLRAAVENLTEYPEMSPVMRSAFENVLVQESLNLIESFNALAGSCHVIMQAQNHLTELEVPLLCAYLAQYLQGREIPAAAPPAESCGIKVDLYGLLLVLDYLAATIRHKQKGTGLSCAFHAGEKFMYIDLIWSGAFIPTADVEKLLETRLEKSLGQMTVASILRAMDGDIWSLQRENSQSSMRLALPIAVKTGTLT